MKLTLKTKYPCCYGAARFVTETLVPRERFDRVCRYCRQRWTVTRRTLLDGTDVRVDELTWEHDNRIAKATRMTTGEF